MFICLFLIICNKYIVHRQRICAPLNDERNQSSFFVFCKCVRFLVMNKYIHTRLLHSDCIQCWMISFAYFGRWRVYKLYSACATISIFYVVNFILGALCAQKSPFSFVIVCANNPLSKCLHHAQRKPAEISSKRRSLMCAHSFFFIVSSHSIHILCNNK